MSVNSDCSTMNKILFVLLTLFVSFRYGTSDSSDSSSSSSEESESALELKGLTDDFFTAFAEWLNSDTPDSSDFFDEGVYFADDVIFCETAAVCSYSREEAKSNLSAFQSATDLQFSNIDFIGVNPDLPLRPVSVAADEIFTLFNGCKITLPQRLNFIYFDENGLITQYHVVDSDSDAILRFFELVSGSGCE